MLEWFKIYRDPEIQKKESVKFAEVAGKKICIVKDTDGSFFAVQDKCPHAGGRLSDGWCEQGKVFCPNHHRSFNLITGRGSGTQGDFVYTYPMEVREDGVYIGIDIKTNLWKKIMQLFR